MAKTVTDPSKPKPKSDAYTGMLLLSLLLLLGASALVYLDFSRYPTSKPPAVPKVAPISNPLEGGGQPGGAPKGPAAK
jgi:hypothetical protein